MRFSTPNDHQRRPCLSCRHRRSVLPLANWLSTDRWPPPLSRAWQPPDESTLAGDSTDGRAHARRQAAAAFDHGSGLVLAQTDVDGKPNEITRLQPLLERLGLHDRVVTADALHTQREHATFLIEQKRAHYVLIVKKNQPSLYAQVQRLSWKQIPIQHRERDRGHGREERRTLKVVTVKNGLLFPGDAAQTPGQRRQRGQMTDCDRLRDHRFARLAGPSRRPGRPAQPREIGQNSTTPVPYVRSAFLGCSVVPELISVVRARELDHDSAVAAACETFS
ncbi:ISAs1 family transposase [Nonomuraea sp. NPDC050643]|uniref:ISAs1 family transposase n=1 Tax=Nonomuraea sp. NPDC050643 TaxID=3155660 RepID=UPI0033C4D71E